MSNFKTSDRGCALIHSFESCARKGADGLIYPYLDDVGVPTIGWGSTYYPDGRKVSMQDPAVTQQQADFIFKAALAGFETSVNSLVKSQINQNQFDALVCFSYNTGGAALASSTLLRRVNANPSDPTIRDAFLMWVNGLVEGKLVPLPGLVRRRGAEADLYFTPVS